MGACNWVPAGVGGARPFSSFLQIQCGARPVRIIRNYRYDPLPGRRLTGLRLRKLRESGARGPGYEMGQYRLRYS